LIKKEESTKIIDTEDEDDNNSTLSSFFTNSHTGVSTDFSDKSTIVMKNIDSKICNSKVDVTSNKKIVEPLENSSSDVFIKKYKQEIKFTDIESLSFNSKLENALENYTKKKKKRIRCIHQKIQASPRVHRYRKLIGQFENKI